MALALVAAQLCAGCGEDSGRGRGRGGGGGGALPDLLLPSPAGLDADSIDPGGPTDTSDCAAGNTDIYLIDSDANLYTFHPPTLALTRLGPVSCPDDSASPFSMSVNRQGHAFVVYTDGNLFDVDTTTLACKSTPFTPGQNGFNTFGMGFSVDSNGGSAETLYVSDSPFDVFFTSTSKGLARIDLSNFSLVPVNAYDKITARAEMTGTGDGRLFAAFEGAPYIVAQIDKATAKVLSEAPQTAINYAPDTSNFAFAFWGGDFWLFVGPGGSTDVFQYQPASSKTTRRTTLSQEIVGAGVSTCAPVLPPS